MYVCIYIYIYTYIYIYACIINSHTDPRARRSTTWRCPWGRWRCSSARPSSSSRGPPFREKQMLRLCEPLLCNPAAETPILPPIWCSESLPFPHVWISGGVLLSQTPV